MIRFLVLCLAGTLSVGCRQQEAGATDERAQGETLGAFYIRNGYFGFGEIVGRAGDVNKDGVPDFILGDNGISREIPPSLWIVSVSYTHLTLPTILRV